MKNTLKKNLLVALLIMVGMIGSSLITYTFAHGGDTNLIHGCVRKITGVLRVVGANDTCLPTETALDWNIQGPPGPAGGGSNVPLVCPHCDLTRHADNDSVGTRLKGKDLSNAYLPSATLGNADFSNINFSNAIFVNGRLGDNDDPITNNLFMNDNFTGAQLSAVQFLGADFTNANFTNARIDGAGFKDVVLTGAQMTTAELTGTTWNNTICPDGTNSDANGNTCIGHL